MFLNSPVKHRTKYRVRFAVEVRQISWSFFLPCARLLELVLTNIPVCNLLVEVYRSCLQRFSNFSVSRRGYLARESSLTVLYNIREGDQVSWASPLLGETMS
jgi:hypothetical protein